MKQLRATIKQLPFAEHVYGLLRLLRGRNARFSADYTNNSGVGSTLEATRAVSRALPGLLNSLQVKSFLDIPCGDFTWISRVDFGPVRYIGADVIDSLIEKHRKNADPNKRSFVVLDLVESKLPCVDLVFVRDCLVHLSNRLALNATDDIKQSQS